MVYKMFFFVNVYNRNVIRIACVNAVRVLKNKKLPVGLFDVTANACNVKGLKHMF